MNSTMRLLLCTFFLLLAACSPGDDDGSADEPDHVWKAQTDTIEKARQVEQVLQEAAENKRRELENQLQ